MTQAHTSVTVDGVRVRAVKAPCPRPPLAWPTRSAYPIEVDGVLYGYLVSSQPSVFSRSGHTGWEILALTAWEAWDETARPNSVARCYFGQDVKLLLAKVPGLITSGAMFTAERAAEIVAEAKVKHAEHQARLAADKAERDARKAAEPARRAERIAAELAALRERLEGLESLRWRLAADLTNFETVALEKTADLLRAQISAVEADQAREHVPGV